VALTMTYLRPAAACAAALGFLLSYRTDAVQYIYFSPTPAPVAEAMLNLARVSADDVVYDLGSGDGRIVLLAAEKYGARGVGLELVPSLVEVSRKAARERHVDDKVAFIEADFFKADISEATVVTLYLSPSVNRMLESKLRGLKPGTRIVSHNYGIGNWPPDDVVRGDDGTDIFLWTVPKRPARTPDVPFTATHPAVAEAMLTLARVGPDDVVYDLGSGDGRIVILAAQKYGARGVGVELEPTLVEAAREVAREGAVADRVTFVEADLFTADISDATVVMLALSAEVNAKLELKLKGELRPGARIVSRQFGIGGWRPDETARGPDGTALFLWTVPPSRPKDR
jgi:predicted RNA methylase